ncbi:hypothetical protein DFH07DRAFT_304164 [Mycena maculata]|uniref:T6SS Phospholipase effector Tle1-like catalytic domain-containing protein n=1 Tax=Mycena maculata TaxID=230809 RepID=A0AAD7MJU1_9AGAR|nr:hypothetical protein DFH07DRAFT_304164 [Mycena maculata]
MSTSAHAQEATMASTTDTIVERPEAAGRPSFRSDVTALDTSGTGTLRSVEEKDQREAHRSLPSVPPDNNHRCLILCFDGTGDQFDADNSNIVQLVSALKKNDRTKQMVYYQSGIGTYTSPKLATPLTAKISLTVDAAIAWNLGEHVMAGYEFLMQNYTANDRICIFGFSRGAYIARSLAGMIHKVGLLPADNHQQVPFAYRMYTRTDATGWAQSNAFKKAFSNDVHIDFIGVWDTVDSVGLIPKRLPFTTSNTIVRTFRHAVSLDEHRAKFKANLWNFPSDAEKKLGTHTPPPTPTLPALPKRGYTFPRPNLTTHFRSSTTLEDGDAEMKFEEAYAHNHQKTRRTDVLEVWFAGCHTDVGGGSVPNDTRHSLARIPLRWMIRECFKADTGMLFDPHRLQQLGLDPATLYPLVLPRPPPLPVGTVKIESIPKRKLWLRRLLSRKQTPEFTVSPEPEDTPPEKPSCGMEEEEDLKDALSPIYDQLKLKPFWWILEVIPMSFRSQRLDDKWNWEVYANRGRPRSIPHQRQHVADPDHPHYKEDHKPVVNLKVHRSVETRRAARDAKGRPYVNRARFHCEPQWVD